MVTGDDKLPRTGEPLLVSSESLEDSEPSLDETESGFIRDAIAIPDTITAMIPIIANFVLELPLEDVFFLLLFPIFFSMKYVKRSYRITIEEITCSLD